MPYRVVDGENLAIFLQEMVYSKADYECKSTYDLIKDRDGINLIALENLRRDTTEVRFFLPSFYLIGFTEVMNLEI